MALDKLEVAYLKTLESNLKMAQESAKHYKDKVAPLEETIKLLIAENTRLRKEKTNPLQKTDISQLSIYGGIDNEPDDDNDSWQYPDDDDYDDSINWGHDSDDENEPAGVGW